MKKEFRFLLSIDYHSAILQKPLCLIVVICYSCNSNEFCLHAKTANWRFYIYYYYKVGRFRRARSKKLYANLGTWIFVLYYIMHYLGLPRTAHPTFNNVFILENTSHCWWSSFQRVLPFFYQLSVFYKKGSKGENFLRRRKFLVFGIKMQDSLKTQSFLMISKK